MDDLTAALAAFRDEKARVMNEFREAIADVRGLAELYRARLTDLPPDPSERLRALEVALATLTPAPTPDLATAHRLDRIEAFLGLAPLAQETDYDQPRP